MSKIDFDDVISNINKYENNLENGIKSVITIIFVEVGILIFTLLAAIVISAILLKELNTTILLEDFSNFVPIISIPISAIFSWIIFSILTNKYSFSVYLIVFILTGLIAIAIPFASKLSFVNKFVHNTFNPNDIYARNDVQTMITMLFNTICSISSSMSLIVGSIKPIKLFSKKQLKKEVYTNSDKNICNK